MSETTRQRETLDEMICSDDLPRRLARIYARILARAAEEEVTPSSERPQIATPVLEATSATKLGQVLELVDGGSEDETQA